MIQIESTASDFAQKWREICTRNPVDAEELAIVDQILAEVKAEGEAAVLRWSAEFDKTNYGSLEEAVLIPDESWLEGVDSEVLEALKVAAKRVQEYHEKQKPDDFEYSDAHGNVMGNRWIPVQRVGLYVPGGKAAYPSSVLMNAIPAKVAGVRELTVVTPPGYMKPEVKAAAYIAGVDRVIGLGGIQAVAALAYGAGVVQAVDTIVGPGNKYVASAKRKAFGTVAIDMIAGPSEVLILSDGSVDPSWVAADLLSQAEHDEAAVCGLLTSNADYGEAVALELERQAKATARSEIAWPSVRDHAFVVVVPDRETMIQLANEYAPEHLELAVENPSDWLPAITEAGSIFVGAYCPEPVGDYLAGPNHVLPTSGTARFFSPLGVDTFMKRSAWTEWTRDGLAAYKDAIVTLAESEELIAHADAVRIRFKD